MTAARSTGQPEFAIPRSVIPGSVISRAAILGAVLLLAACQPQQGRLHLQDDEKMIISQGTWDYYQDSYLRDIAGGKRGAFVVSEDGFYAMYHYCPIMQGCYYSINYSNEAIKSCQSKGYKCIVFAKDDEIVIPYEVAE